ncbi:unnamed protein product, partial [Rotaria sordida]
IYVGRLDRLQNLDGYLSITVAG